MTAFLLGLLLMQTAANTGSIGGVVLKAGTAFEQSLQNARLELSDPSGTRVTRTGPDGGFTFANLRPGRYRLSVTKDRFIRSELNLTLAPGQQKRDVAFRLEPAPTITGWVQDYYGEPIANVLIEALRRSYDARGNPTMRHVASAVTDDLGKYRIYWVDPGDYFLLAGSAPQPGETAADRGVPPTYFPNVTVPQDAKSIRVPVGREINGADFRLQGAGRTPFEGYLNSSITGRGIGATITLVPPAADPSPSSYRAQSIPSGDRAGQFEIAGGVASGTYTVVARATSGDLSGFTSVVVRPPIRQLPKYDLRLTLTPPLTVEGQFFVDGGTVPDLSKSKVEIVALNAALPSPKSVAPLANGRLSIPGSTPGSYLVRVSDLPDDFYLKAARFETTDVLENLLDVPKAIIAPLQLLIGADGGRLNAAVFDRKDQPVPDIQAVLVPDAARRHRPDQFRVVATNEDGHAAFRGIPPGDYKLFAWENLEPNAYLNADFIRLYDDAGVRVHIDAGDNAPISTHAIPSEF